MNTVLICHPWATGHWWQALQALESHCIADLSRLDGTQQDKEFIESHLSDLQVVPVITRKGLELVGCLHDLLEHGVGVNLKDAGHSTNAQAFSQCACGPHQHLG
jgi:hypothetical protein